MSEHDTWNKRFAASEYIFGTEPNAFIKAQGHRLAPGMRVLCVADGEGRNGVYLAGLGLDVLSLDFSENAQGKARRLAKERGVTLRFELGDVLNWTWPKDHFDAVVAVFIQFAPPMARAQLFDGIKRSIKPGGLILMQGYRPEQLQYKTGGPSEIEQLTTRALLMEFFGDWDDIDIAEYDRVIEEGPRHIGMSALIDLVARKPLRG